MKKVGLPLLVLALMAPLGSTTSAADLRNVLTDYALTSWDRKDGLPRGNIWSLAQDAAGYLWVGGDAGLFRFDGVRFMPSELLASPRIPNLPVRAVSVSTPGDLWVGFAGSGGVSRIKNGRTYNYGQPDGLPAGVVTMVVEDSTGSVWAGNNHGLYRFVNDRWEGWAGRGLPEGAVYSGYNDRRGHLVIENEVGVFWRKDGQESFELLERYDEAMRTAIRGVVPRAITADGAGGIWVSDPIVGFRKVGDRPRLASSPDRGRGTRLLRDRAGNLWVSTGGQGLWRVSFRSATQAAPTVERATSLTGLLADGVYALLEDRDGNIWAGTTEGLNRLTPRRITQFVDLGLVQGVETTADGSVWVGTVDGLVQFKPPGDKERHWSQSPGSRLMALHADEHGTLWVATDEKFMRLHEGSVSSVPLGRQRPGQIEAITSDSRGGVFLYDSEEGLLRWNGKELRPVPLPTDLRHSEVLFSHTDKSGNAWIGFTGGHVALLGRDSQLHVYGPKDGLDAGDYRAIYERADGTFWLGGTQGLSRFASGRFATMHAGTEFPVDYVTAVVEDNSGSLWLGTRLGIVRIDSSEFDRFLSDRGYRAHYTLFDRSDGIAGMPVARSNNRRVIRATDGRLWFVTSRGMTVIDPGALHNPSALPPVQIERVVTDERDVPALPQIALPKRTRSLEIDYGVLDLTSPLKARFRYRLEGFDHDWIDAGTRRQVFYTNLPPGSYRFHVTANNDQGPWVDRGTSWDFSVTPMFYQTIWFYVASATAFAFIVWAAWRFRIRQVRKQFALLLGERVRLSREIHDTLLQGVVGLALQFDALAADFDGPTPERRQRFVRVRKQIEEYIREARQAIWDLRSLKLHNGDLVQALREASEHAAAENGIRLEFNVSGTPLRCSSGVQEQLLKIGKEAIVNAVRHAQANLIHVELRYSDASLTLQVSDDGRGFDPARATGEGEVHYGLLGMKERAQEVGGGFTIASSIGRGTQVTAVVPIKVMAAVPVNGPA